MKIRDFIKQNVDIDVSDNICEVLNLAFVGPVELKPEGEARFKEALDMEIKITDADISFESSSRRLWSRRVALVVIDSDDESWRPKLRAAYDFFWAAAGYCVATDWDKWFVDNDV